MDKSDDIKKRYAKEAATYRVEAPLINFDFEKLFEKLLWITSRIFTDNTVKLKFSISEQVMECYQNLY